MTRWQFFNGHESFRGVAVSESFYRITILGRATMSKAVWISVFVLLTNAVPLEHTNTHVTSSLEHTNTRMTSSLEKSNNSTRHDATGQCILIDDDTFLKIAGIVNSSSSSSPSNLSSYDAPSLGTLMGLGYRRKKRHIGGDSSPESYQPLSLDLKSQEEVGDSQRDDENKINVGLKRVERETDIEVGGYGKSSNIPLDNGPKASVKEEEINSKDFENGRQTKEQENVLENRKLSSDKAIVHTGDKTIHHPEDETPDKISDNTQYSTDSDTAISHTAITRDNTMDNTPDEIPDSRAFDTADKTVVDTVDTQAGTADNTKEKTADKTAEDNTVAQTLLEMKIVELPSSPSSDKTSLQKSMTCEHVPSFYNPRWLWMVTECPPTWTDDTVRDQCLAQKYAHTLSLLELLVSLPVQDSSGNVYANEFCAQCQGVVSHSPWTAEVACKPTNAMPEIPNSKLEFASFNRQLSNYFAGPDCERNIQPAMPSGVRNCKTGRLMQSYHPFWRGRFTRTDPRPSSNGKGNYGVPFTILFNFDFTGRKNLMFEVSTRVEHERTTGFRCRAWETYDPHINDCRQVNCNRNYILVDNKCVQDIKDENLAKYTITSLKELNLVRQATQVTIRMNVSISKSNADNSDMERYKTDLARILQVGAERMKNFKLSFTPGTIPDAVFSYEVLTREQYQELFPPLPAPLPEEQEVFDIAQPQAAQSLTNVEVKTRNSAGDDEFVRSSGAGDTGNDGIVGKNSSSSSGKDPHNGSSSTTEDDTSSDTTGTTSPADSSDSATDTSQNKPADPSNTEVDKTDSAAAGVIQPACSIPNDVLQPMVMQIDFVLVPAHNNSDGDSRKLMRRIQQLNHRFIIQMIDGDIKFKETPLPEDFADTTQFCPWGIEHRLESEEFTTIEDTDGNLMLYVNKTNSYLKMGRFDLFIRMAGDDAADLTNVREEAEFAFGCFMPRINQQNCIRISLKSDEYTIEGDQKDLMFEGHSYDVFSYSVSNETTGEVQICLPNSFNQRVVVSKSKWYAVVESCGSSFLRVQQAEAMITDILGRVSLVALSIVLITYLLFPRLRNLPGINTMNLTFALLVAETMFSHGIDAKLPWLCTAVAVSLHYLFLAAHFWMNVMSYDVYRTFVSDVSGSMPMKRVKDKKKYVPLYSLYAWGTPLLIVAFCLVVDKSEIFPGVGIGYGVSSTINPHTIPAQSNSSLTNGSFALDDTRTSVPDNVPTASNLIGNTTTAPTQESSNTKKTALHGPSQLSYCWITEPLAAFISFGAPILIIFMANCIFFARIITTISRTARLSKTRLQTTSSTTSLNRKQPVRSDAVLYLRMSTVMGFTWIFGLSSSIVSSFSRPAFEICVISHTLGILFTIFNISQGIFIFGAFVCNKRVWNLYRALFTRMRTALSERGSKPTIYVVNSTTTLTNLSDGVTTRQ